MKSNTLVTLLFLSAALLTGCGKEPVAQSQQISLPGQDIENVTSVSANSRVQTEVALNNYPKVRLQTNKGTVVIALYDDKAPATVRNFLAYVQSGHYNNTVFHRVVDNLLIQGGGYGPDYRLKPERAAIAYEASSLRNLRGTLAAARRSNDANSSGAQFFINLVDNPQFDGGTAGQPQAGYTVFGEVIEGMAVLDGMRSVPIISRAGVGNESPQQALILQSAQLQE